MLNWILKMSGVQILWVQMMTANDVTGVYATRLLQTKLSVVESKRRQIT